MAHDIYENILFVTLRKVGFLWMDTAKIWIAPQLLVEISNIEFQGHLPNDLGADTLSDGWSTRHNLHSEGSFFAVYRSPEVYNEYGTFLRNGMKPRRTASD